jgi:hypothetical protein
VIRLDKGWNDHLRRWVVDDDGYEVLQTALR